MSATKRLDAQLKIKSISEEGEFSGYGSVFGVEDSYGDVVVSGAFEESLKEWKEKGRLPSMLWQHNRSEPIGIYTKIEEDDQGLYVEGKLLIDGDSLAQRAHAHLKAGSISGLSIGYNLGANGWRWDSEKEVFILSKIDLWEVSLVTFPSNDEARVEEVKSLLQHGEMPSKRLVEKHLRDVGLSQQQAKAFIADGYSGIAHRDDGESVELVKSINSLISRLR